MDYDVNYRSTKKKSKIPRALMLPIIYIPIAIFVVGDKYLSLPPHTGFNVSSGIYSTVRNGRDTLISLAGSKDDFYTCSLGMFSRSHCFGNAKNEEFNGKLTTIRWYRQSILPNKNSNKVVSLSVEGTEILTPVMTRQSADRELKVAIWLQSIATFCISLLSLILHRISRKKNNE